MRTGLTAIEGRSEVQLRNAAVLNPFRVGSCAHARESPGHVSGQIETAGSFTKYGESDEQHHLYRWFGGNRSGRSRILRPSLTFKITERFLPVIEYLCRRGVPLSSPGSRGVRFPRAIKRNRHVRRASSNYEQRSDDLAPCRKLNVISIEPTAQHRLKELSDVWPLQNRTKG